MTGPGKSLKAIKDFVKSEIHRRNWSERDLSKASGLSPPTINEFLNLPNKDVRIVSLQQIARALGHSPAYLLMTADERAEWNSLKNRATTIDKKTLLEEAERQVKELLKDFSPSKKSG